MTDPGAQPVGAGPATAPPVEAGSAASLEQPAWIPRSGGDLFAVVTRPPGAPGLVAVLHSGGHGLTAHHRNGMYVRMARALAGAGVASIRFDYQGVGESGGSTKQRFLLERPARDDTLAVVEWARGEGFQRFALVGSCFGARTALAAAPAVEGLEALVLLAPPVRDVQSVKTADTLTITGGLRRALRADVLRRLTERKRRERYLGLARARLTGRAGPRARGSASPAFRTPLAAVAERGIPTLVAYGAGDTYHDQWERAAGADLAPVLARAGDRLQVQLADTHLHGFTSLAVQDWTVATTVAWLADRAAAR